MRLVTLFLVGGVCLLLSAYFGFASAPHYEIILSLSIMFAVGAIICFVLAFKRVGKVVKILLSIFAIAALYVFFQAMVRLLK